MGEWFLWELNEMKHITHFLCSLVHSKCSIAAVGTSLVFWMAPSHLSAYFLHCTEIICNFRAYLFVYLFVLWLNTVSSLKQGPGLIYRQGGFPRGRLEAIDACSPPSPWITTSFCLQTKQVFDGWWPMHVQLDLPCARVGLPKASVRGHSWPA